MIADCPPPPPVTTQIYYCPLFIDIKHVDTSKPGVVRFTARMLTDKGRYAVKSLHALPWDEARSLGIVS